MTKTKGYEKLSEVLDEALNQAAVGKGAVRHASDLPFHEQPMQQISHLLNSEKGMAFQAIKKLREGLAMPETDRKIAELLGAINYIAGIVIYLRADRERVAPVAEWNAQDLAKISVSMPAPYRDCRTCKHETTDADNYPCKSCEFLSLWESR